MSKRVESELSRLLELLDRDGIVNIDIKIEVEPTIKKRNTGEVDESYQSIRERIVSEDELQDMVNGKDWYYNGTIDVVGDFHVRDRFSLFTTIKGDD